MERLLKILVIADVIFRDKIDAILTEEAAGVSVVYYNAEEEEADLLISSIWEEEVFWDVVFSVYSDYIVPKYALDKIKVPLNIHPALPNHPGVGYDVLPLIDGGGKCGATIHWMDEKIDHGVVLESKVVDFPSNETYTFVRNLNQKAVLFLFEKWFRLALENQILENLQIPVMQGRGWSGDYISKSIRRTKLIKFKQSNSLEWARLKIPADLFMI